MKKQDNKKKIQVNDDGDHCGDDENDGSGRE